MRRILFFLLLLAGQVNATSVRIQLSAPAYPGQRALLYRFIDQFTRRTELLANARIDERGQAVLDADVTGTTKAAIRIGEVSADLWLRSGAYSVEFPAVDPNKPRSVNGTTEVDLLFRDIDRTDI